ncbi:MAG: hypothetical protein AAF901_14935, partial [Bacteroidota bacterium]
EGESVGRFNRPIPPYATEWYINKLNEGMEANGVDVFFYLMAQNIEERRDEAFYRPSEFQSARLLEEDRVSSYMNIHFSLESAGTPSFAFGGRANFPNEVGRYSMLLCTNHDRFVGDTIERRIPSLIHEIGHTFDLLHTYRSRTFRFTNNGEATKCFQESVSHTKRQGFGCFKRGLKCAVNGDLLCSTEADPFLRDASMQVQVLITLSIDFVSLKI